MNGPSIAAACAAALLPLAAGCAGSGPTDRKELCAAGESDSFNMVEAETTTAPVAAECRGEGG
ncbi:hypothetical protein ABTW95_00845 [Spirillospora sp. NPDC127506]